MTLQVDPVRNRIVQRARSGEHRAASFFTADTQTLVSIGNLEDDFEVIKSADWVIEAIIEKFNISGN
jgi:3-hydroxyacyl-CoA dehydrogenase